MIRTTLLALAISALSSTLSSADSTLTLENFRDSLEPKGFVLNEPGWHVWCNAPILDDDGSIHLFVSRWQTKHTFGRGWWTACEIARYTADQAEGPYTFQETILKGNGNPNSWRMQGIHNVTAVRLPDKRFALLFIGNTGGKGNADGFPANQKIGLMLADSPAGPWKLAGDDGLILDRPEDPDVWSHGSVVGVNNPTLLPMPDGRFFLYYKAMRPGKGQVRQMGLAIANKIEGPYTFQKKPLTQNKGTIEDGFAFHLNDKVNLLVTDCHGDGYGGGMIYQSADGTTFGQSPIRAYEAVDHYMERWPQPAKGWTPWTLQRPALLIGLDGTPTHLFAPCGTPPEGSKGTGTFLFKIVPKDS